MGVKRVGKGVDKSAETDVRQMVDLGWANGWADDPPVLAECRALRHHPLDVDIGPKWRGLHHVVTCHECGYIYHYDSSD